MQRSLLQLALQLLSSASAVRCEEHSKKVILVNCLPYPLLVRDQFVQSDTANGLNKQQRLILKREHTGTLRVSKVS